MARIRKLTFAVFVAEEDVEQVRENVQEFFYDAPVPMYRPDGWIAETEPTPSEMTPTVKEFFAEEEIDQ